MTPPTHDLYGRAEQAWTLGAFDEARDLYGKLLKTVVDPWGQDYLRRKLTLLDRLGHKAPAWNALRPLRADEPPIPAAGPLLLFFFQFDCPDCRSAAPVVASLGNRFAPRGLQNLWVDVPLDLPERHGPEAVEGFTGPWGGGFPRALDEPGGTLLRAYGATETPFAALVDAEGTLRYLDFPWPERLEERLRQVLGGDP